MANPERDYVVWTRFTTLYEKGYVIPAVSAAAARRKFWKLYNAPSTTDPFNDDLESYSAGAEDVTSTKPRIVDIREDGT